MKKASAKSRALFAGVAVLLVIVGATVFLTRSSHETAIQIGGVYSLTGKAASFGKEIKNGVDLAVEEVNRTGGINGKKLEVVSEDTGSEPKNAVSAFEKLIAVNKIPAAVGFVSSSEAVACVPVAERAKVVMITPIASSPKLEGAGQYVFRTREGGAGQAHKVAEYVFKDLGLHKAAILCENAANSIGYREAFVERFRALGGTITADLTYEEGQTDFRPALTQLKELNPKAIYVPGVGKVIGRVLKQAKELGLQGRFFSSAGIEDPELFRIAGVAANGVVYGAPDFSLGSDNPTTKSFVQAYRQRFGEDPSVYSANAYDALILIANALRDGKSGPPHIREFLLAVVDHAGAGGRLRQRAGALSGGEKQMVALAMGLITRPRLLLLDEPSLGLAPPLVIQTLAHIHQISRDSNVAVLIVEQKVREVLTIAQRVYVLRNGVVSFSGPAESLRDEQKLRDVYL